MTEKRQPLLEAKALTTHVIKPVSWLASVTFVNHLVRDNNILLSILGVKGSGKTQFSQILQSHLSPDIQSYLLTATSLSDDLNIMQQINSLMTTAADLTIANLIEHVNERNIHTLLIIDEAQYLSSTFIQAILHALNQQKDTCYFHVCLISDFSLVPILNALAQENDTDRIHSIELGALNEAETRVYVEQNLSLLPDSQSIITEDKFLQFYQLTQGHIHSINHHMTDFFSHQTPLRSSHSKRSRQLGMCLGALFTAIGITYIVQSQDSKMGSQQTVTAELQSRAIATPPQVAVLDSRIPPYHLAATLQLLEEVSLRREGLENKEEDDYDAQNKSLVVLDKVVVAPKVLRPTVKPRPVANKQIPVVKKNQTPIVKRAIVKQTAKANYVKPIKKSNQYTIQLLASSNRGQLQTYARAHHLIQGTQVYRVHHSGQDWYVLTLGQYMQKNHATIAVKQLPSDIAKNKPWVRLISDFG